MTDPRKPIFDAVRSIARPGLFNDAGYVLALDNLLDAFGVPRLISDQATKARLLSKPAAFFASLREARIFGDTIDQGEVDGTNAILAACGDAGWPVGDTAYACATAYHETAGTMRPIMERGGPTYLRNMYDINGSRPAKARELGNLSPGDGLRYCGRGYVQLTGRKNYLRAGAALGIDLIADPDRALEPAVAAKIMVRGMREGWFTGRDLDDDIPRDGPATLQQFSDSRDIINGKDKALKIAAEAMTFQNALIAGGWA